MHLAGRGDGQPRYALLNLLVMPTPADPAGISWLIVLPLNHVLRAAVIKSENGIIHVFAERHCSKSSTQIVGRFSVHLRMRVEVVVAMRSCDSKRDSARPSALILTSINIRIIVRNSKRDE